MKKKNIELKNLLQQNQMKKIILKQMVSHLKVKEFGNKKKEFNVLYILIKLKIVFDFFYL